jgi:acyl-CoA synthetase (NDP forming)
MVRAMLDRAAPLGIGFSQVVSLGDMAVDFCDMLDYLATMRQVRDPFVCRGHHA